MFEVKRQSRKTNSWLGPFVVSAGHRTRGRTPVKTAQRRVSRLVAFACAILPGTIGLTQSKNEVGLLLGGSIVPTSTINLSIDSGLVYQATYARKFGGGRGLGFGFEVPFIAIPSQDVESNSPTTPRNYASIFITPGFRVTFAPNSAVSPWASIGGGYARFAESSTLVTGMPNPFKTGTNKGALQYGGGVDFKTHLKILLPLVLRAEVRDFYTGQPRLNIERPGSGQHNVIISGGIVLRF
jgi:opacity protein-like surface antigen